MRKCFLIVLLLFTNANQLFAQRTNPFLSITGNRGYPDIKQAVPYNKGIGQFDFIDSTDVFIQKSDSVYSYALYFELNDSLQELGFRFISPLPANFSPNKGDRVSFSFDNTDDDKQIGFKANLQLCKLQVIQQDSTWIQLKDETPSRLKEKSNETIRITDKNGLKKIAPGIYRILITTKQAQRPFGYYAIQFGAIPFITFPALEKVISTIH